MFHKTIVCGSRHSKSVLKTLNTRHYSSIKVAIVGSGPAGFYTTQNLLKNPNVHVDIYEKLPVPFGLVRYGVAPDHPEVKNVIKSFTNIATRDKVNFYGNISLGSHITLDDLITSYHAVVLCYGSSRDKMLNIEGEKTTKNTISARNFVGWYNGVPEDKDLDIDLDCETACIIGNGNVALDCARILMKPPRIEKTDITNYAQKMISQSKIKRIYILGRRGPIQAAFTAKELRELRDLDNGYLRLEPSSLFRDAGLTFSVLNRLSRRQKRIAQLLIDISLNPIKPDKVFQGTETVFKFLYKPIRIIGDPQTGKVKQLEMQRNEYKSVQDFVDVDGRPDETDQIETMDCGLIIRSIGYEAVMIDKNLPVNDKLGSVMNTDGRIHGYRSLYCSGWLATGAVGVIAGTLNSSRVTAQSILDDIDSNRVPGLDVDKAGYPAINKILTRKSVQVVHFNDWLRIDELEKRLGEALNKTREKIVELDKMLDTARRDN